jgi:hypothetical protein
MYNSEWSHGKRCCLISGSNLQILYMDPLVIETLALRDAVSCAVDRNFDRVLFKVNCAELFRLWQIRLDRLNTKDMMS